MFGKDPRDRAADVGRVLGVVDLTRKATTKVG
ncbi:hypothetical protein FHX82_006513 [Amycolatopsis bartoniae]|nr:hypothetical protein [Amycolatopsis bartoniae]